MAFEPHHDHTDPKAAVAEAKTRTVFRLTSLSAKLFYYMTILVLITIAGNSYQYIRTFLGFQTRQIQDQVQLQAERTGNQIESALESWRAQIAVALPTLKTQEGVVDPQLLRRFVDSGGEFVGFQMYGAPSADSVALKSLGEAFTAAHSDPRFEDKVPAKVWGDLKSAGERWIAREAPRAKRQNVIIESFAKTTGLPILMIAVRFDVAKSKDVVWAVLATWQTNVIKALPKSKFINSVVIDGRGKIFSSPRADEMTRRKLFPGPRLRKAALAGTVPAGFEPEYVGEGGKKRLGAFSRLNKYGITVLVEMDSEMAFQEVKKNLSATALWATLFILFAVAFAYVGAKGITRGLSDVTQATERIAAGDFQHQIHPSSRDEIAVLSHAVNNMSKKIVGLMNQQVEQARIEQELETARMVQGTFFPRGDIRRDSVAVAGFYQPATECGGDLWGHFAVRPGLDFIFVADATGHGAPAALVTAICYSTMQTLADLVRNDFKMEDSPARILERLNRIIYEAVQGRICMTFYGIFIDTAQGRIVTANAGHNIPFLMPAAADDPRQSGSARSRAKRGDRGRPISLKASGAPLGLEPDSTYRDDAIPLTAGDKFFLFTDGLIECANPKGTVWGRKTLVDQLMDVSELDASALRQEVVRRAFAFYDEHPLSDDVTLVVIEVDKTWQASAKLAPKRDDAPSPVQVAHKMAVPASPSPVSAAKSATPPPPVIPAASRPAVADVNAQAPKFFRSVEPEITAQMDKTSDGTGQRPSSPTSTPAPSPLGRNGKFKIKLPNTGS